MKALITLLILGAIGYSGVKIIPVYVNNYQLQDYIRQQTPFWLAQQTSGDAVLNNVLAKAHELKLPIKAEQVKVEASSARVAVSIDYTVPIDLSVYTLRLHFTPTSENRSL